jgi:hypothetical protein
VRFQKKKVIWADSIDTEQRACLILLGKYPVSCKTTRYVEATSCVNVVLLQ